MGLDLRVYLAFVSLWALWLMFAAADKMFTVAQMQSKGEAFARGIPLTGHWAMLYLDFVLPVLLAILVYKYGAEWSLTKILVLLGVGLVLSFVMHLTYIDAGKAFPEAPTYGGRLTAAGWLHLLYMGLAFAIIGLFYLGSPSKFDVWLTTVWLVVHVIVGVHVPLKLLKPVWFPYHGIWDAGTLAPIFGSAAILVGLSWWALR